MASGSDQPDIQLETRDPPGNRGVIRENEDDSSQWHVVGANKKRKNSASNASTSDSQPTESADWRLQLRVKFVGKSVWEFLYRDAPTILHLLKMSPFCGKFRGKGKLNTDQFCMFLQISDEILSLIYLP